MTETMCSCGKVVQCSCWMHIEETAKEVGELRVIIIELNEQVKQFQAYIEAMEKEVNKKSNIVLPGGI